MAYDAAVVGAGIGGSGLAKLLAERGWTVLLLDRNALPKHKVCGEFLSPESKVFLREMGLLNEVMALGPAEISRIRLHLDGGGRIELPLPKTAFGISRRKLDAALLDAAIRSGVHVLQSATVTEYVPCGAGWTVTASVGRETRKFAASTVIAAWGGTPIRLKGGAPIGLKGDAPIGLKGGAAVRTERNRRRAEPSVGVKSHYIGNGFAEDAVELYFFAGGYLGVNAIEDGKFNAAALLEQKDIPRRHKTVADMLEAAASRHSALGPLLSSAAPVPGTQAATAPVRIAQRPSAWGDIAHVGDAMGRIPPLCGDGMSIALRSAQLCADYADRFLRGELTLGQWRDGYAAAAAAEFAGPLRWGRALQFLLQAPLLPRALPGLAKLAPFAARALVGATRLSRNG